MAAGRSQATNQTDLQSRRQRGGGNHSHRNKNLNSKSHHAKPKISPTPLHRTHLIKNRGEAQSNWSLQDTWVHYRDSCDDIIKIPNTPQSELCVCVCVSVRICLLNQWWHFPPLGFHSTEKTRHCLALDTGDGKGERGKGWKTEREGKRKKGKLERGRELGGGGREFQLVF